MYLAFKFHYIHNNGLFYRLSQRIFELSPLTLVSYEEDDFYIIEASGNQEELETLADLISNTVPQSLFLKNSSLEEIEALHVKTLQNKQEYNYQTPYCPECQKKIEKTLNPFEPCSVCGFSEQNLRLKDITKNEETSEDFFLKLADTLIAQREIELLTYNGKRRFSLLSTEEQDGCGILICDPSDISSSFLITQGELDALMMLEKPSVRLKPKTLFYHENSLKKPLYNVFFADDTITLALSSALSQKGVKMLYCDKPPSLHVSSALGHHLIIQSGRDMQNFNCKSPYATLDSVVHEHHLQNKALCSIYLSKEHLPHISSFSPKIGYTTMVEFSDALLDSPRTMMIAIGLMDEEGERLLENFKTSFSELYDTLLHVEFEVDENLSMISRLWAMAAHIIGITSEQNIKISAETLEATALEFQGKSGPRIDYKVIQTKEGYQLDPRLAIRSAMSFKLAGVDEYLLSFGFIDSLADFIAQQTEFADGNVGIDGVVLSGSLFENHQLLMRTYNAISPNYKVYTNERFSIECH